LLKQLYAKQPIQKRGTLQFYYGAGVYGDRKKAAEEIQYTSIAVNYRAMERTVSSLEKRGH
jgi:hypothetical protein